MSIGSLNLTEQMPEAAITEPGMAYFAGTGPFGKTCGGCKHFGTRRRVNHNDGSHSFKSHDGCDQYTRMIGSHGVAISPKLRACKYFEERRK